MVWRLQPRVDLDYDAAGTEQARGFLGRVDLELATQDMVSAVATLRQRPEVSGKIATLGFCIGGQLSYRVAASGAADAAVCYYGGGIHNHLDLAARIDQPILFHYAGLDKLIPPTAVAAVKDSFAGQANAHFHDYPHSDHGFNCWGRPAYDQRSAALARGRTLEFLAQVL
jgi:carboxymethylenebutenolidase